MAFSINLTHPTLSKHLVTPLKSWLTFQFTSDLVWMNHFAAVTKKAPQGIRGYSFSFQLQSENLNSVFEQCPVAEQSDTNNLFGDLDQLETQGKLVSCNPSELRATSKRSELRHGSSTAPSFQSQQPTRCGNMFYGNDLFMKMTPLPAIKISQGPFLMS